MKKTFTSTLLILFFAAQAYAVVDTSEFVHRTTAKELADLARSIKQDSKSHAAAGGNGKGVDLKQAVNAVNTLVQNNGDIKSVIGDGTQSTARTQGNAAFAVNELTIKLYKETSDGNKNLFLSPYSISTALAMVYAGAKGETAKEMEQALGFSPAVHSSMHSLISRINSISPKSAQLHTANAIWPSSDKNIFESYKARVSSDYFSEVTTLDYAKTEEARQTINKWVENKTNGKIKDIVSKGSISNNTPLAITNAIYFKSDWQSKFESHLTKKANFYTANGKTTKTNFMNQTGFFNYVKKDGIELLELPYKDERLSMYIILPQSGHFASAEKALSTEQIDNLITQTVRTNIHISLPKFKMEGNYNLNDTLKTLGVTTAFTDNANFSGMNGLLDISLGVVLHKTFIDVYEAGTEAAAATYVGMKSMALPQRPLEFKADRPFIFLIRDNATGVNLFIGRYIKP